MLCPTCTTWRDSGTNFEPVPPPMLARAKGMVLERRLSATTSKFCGRRRAATGDATEPASDGYRLTVACICGVVFEQWVTSEDADADLLRVASLN